MTTQNRDPIVDSQQALHIVLFQPEIPPNTGNIIRLCANTGAGLHLIGPLGFELDDTRLRRAGLDYHEFAHVQVWSSLQDYQQHFPERRLFAIETVGVRRYTDQHFATGDSLLFGSETKGLPASVLDGFSSDSILRLPMLAGSRSLNLSNSVAVVAYEAWRQLDFGGAAPNA